MKRTTPAFLFALLLAPAIASADDGEAIALATTILNKGAALYDKKDAAAMAATYTEDGRILWYEKDKDTGELKLSEKKGRSEVEGLYRSAFDGASEPSTSRNTVQHARFVTPDILIIQGVFQPNTANAGTYPFVQVRNKKGDRWLVKTLQLFAIAVD
jgi:hypothetical protein